jgi:ribosomal protein L10
MIRLSMVLTVLVLLASLGAQESREDSDYRSGRKALDNAQWDQAIAAFDASAARKGSAADAALYWKAYALNRAGRRDQALATIDALRQAYSSSRWLNDAKALEVEMRGNSGAPVSPGAESDEELKLVAINSLMQADPNRALPILEKLLTGNYSPKIKDRAIFVLTQSSSPEARKVLSNIAKGGSNPELQFKAIRYIGMMGNEDARNELASIYSSSGDKRIKHEVLKAFMLSGSRTFLLNAARSEKDLELRRDAIHQLALTGGQDELWQLYQSEPTVEGKEEILKSMFLAGNSSKLAEIARSDKDPRLRMAAIKSMGLMGSNGHGDVLVSIYKSDQDRGVKDAVLNALFLQQNAKALIDLARGEKNPEMKKEIVGKLSLVHSKETTDYMLEILK